MLEYPPCPVCGGELPLKEFFKVWDPSSRYGHGEASPALECPSCRARLRPKRLRAVLLMMAAVIASFALMIAAMDLFGKNDLATLVTAIAFIALLLWIQNSFCNESSPGAKWRRVNESRLCCPCETA